MSVKEHISSNSNLHLISNNLLLIGIVTYYKETKKIRNICTNTLTKYNRSTHVSYNPHFFNWSYDLRWYLELYSYTLHSVFLLPSKSTSEGHGSFPGKVTYTFIPEWSVPFVILLGLDQ